MNNNPLVQQILFPNHIFSYGDFSSDFHELAGDLGPFSCTPTYPWAQYFYFSLIRKLNLTNRGMAVEFGVAKGGMSHFLGRLFKQNHQKVYSFDTFTGAPFASGPKENAYYKKGDYQTLEGESQLSQFQDAIKSFGLEDTIIPCVGDFSATDFDFNAPGKFSFVHIDCNLFESTKSALNLIWDQVIDGGVIVLDEFFHSSLGVKMAATEFFSNKGLHPVFHLVFPYSVVIIKGEVAQDLYPDIEGNFYDFDLFKENDCFMSALKINVNVLERGPFATLENAKLFLGLLNRPTTSHDVHLYLWLMRDFWNGFYQPLSTYEQRGIITK